MKAAICGGLSGLIGVVCAIGGITFTHWEFWAIIVAANAMYAIGLNE